MSNESVYEVTPPFAALLAQAALVLRSHGFRTMPVSLHGGRSMLIAEDSLFLLGVVEFLGPSDLLSLEASSAFDLAELVVDAGTKHWDAYLVLLSAAAATERGWSEDVTEILYNTRYLRRIVRWGVTPSESAVAGALRPFFSLPHRSTSGPIDPIRLLAEQLPIHGVDPEKAAVALAQWKSSGDSGNE